MEGKGKLGKSNFLLLQLRRTSRNRRSLQVLQVPSWRKGYRKKGEGEEDVQGRKGPKGGPKRNGFLHLLISERVAGKYVRLSNHRSKTQSEKEKSFKKEGIQQSPI